MNYRHTPVLLNEVIKCLAPKPGENFVDCTLGGGGYTEEILKNTAPLGKVLSIDLDTEAIKNFKAQKSNIKKRAVLVHGNFRDLDKITKKYEFRDIDGIVADLGLSSFQIDESKRGITFQKKELLDMRFDGRDGSLDTARFILNNEPEEQLITIFKSYGEEPFSRLIARAVVRERENRQIKYTTELVEIITQSVPNKFKHKAKDSVRRVFQALRIKVNAELESLEQLLPKALELLNPSGRLAIVTFHSLEARMVKEFFVKAGKGCICPPEFPVCICGKKPAVKLLTKKPIKASSAEIAKNPRSKSAELRVVQKI